MFVNQIEVVTSVGDIIEFHLEEYVYDAENPYGIVKLSNDETEIELPVLDMGIDQHGNSVELSIKFKDLTIYADPSTYKRMRPSLVELEKNDGEDGAANNDMGVRKV